MTNTNFKMEIERNNGNIKVYVCKAFYKNAKFYGTSEYKLWQELLNEHPNAELVVKKRQKTEKMIAASCKNMTYENMTAYIKTQKNSKTMLEEFETVKERSKIQNNPYKYVCDWFSKTYPNYKEHETFKDNDETSANTPELKAVNN